MLLLRIEQVEVIFHIYSNTHIRKICILSSFIEDNDYFVYPLRTYVFGHATCDELTAFPIVLALCQRPKEIDPELNQSRHGQRDQFCRSGSL